MQTVQTQNVVPSLSPDRVTVDADSNDPVGSTYLIGAGEPSTSKLNPRLHSPDNNTVGSIHSEEYYPVSGPVYPVNSAPVDWECYVHPNGLPYFANKTVRAVTYENIKDPTVLHEVETYMNTIKNQVHRYSVPFTWPRDWELIIELGKEESNDKAPSHLLVDHTSRRTVTLLSGGPEFCHKRQCVYWEHVRKFPMHHPLSPGAEDEMLAALAHYYTERIHGDDKTTSPFSHVQCEQFISLYKTLKNEIAQTNGVRTWFVSHVMISIWKSREAYKYGEFDAIPRIEPAMEVPQNTKQHIFNACIYIVCFGTHERYREQLRFAHANGGLYVPAFQKSLEDMLQEWTDSNLLGTVFVSASVAFLSVQQIEKTQQTMVLVSTFFSMASIISGVHHLWKHRSQTRPVLHDTQYHVSHAIGKSDDSHMKTTLSAVFLSFPLVFLMWSVISFSVALLDFAFRHTQGASRVFLACIVSVILFTTVCVRLFFYTIWSDPNPKKSYITRLSAAIKRYTTHQKAIPGSSRLSIPGQEKPAAVKLRLMLMKLQDRLKLGADIPV